MTTVSDVQAPRAHRAGWRRKAGRALVIVLAALVVVVGVFLWRPTVVAGSFTRAFLWTKGVHGYDVRLRGERLHFLAGGAGRPVVLIHGLGGRADDWAAVMPRLLAAGFSVYAPDLLGHGTSDKPDVDYSIALQAEMVRQFLDERKLEQVDLLGWSMGGWVALKLAAEQPRRVRTLTLVDSAGFAFNAPDPNVLRPKTRRELEKMATLFSPKAGSIPEFYARDLLRVMANQDWVVARALDAMYSRRDLMDGRVAGLRMPVLLLWGGEDVLTPLSAAQEMHRQIRQSTLEVLAGCGHVAIIECRDRALPVVVGFLQEH